MAKILVSDDDPQVLRFVNLCLEHAGYDVVATADSAEVVALALEGGFHAIILDVMMAPLSGFDVLSELRARPETESVPILFLSGRTGGEDRVRGLREGADDYLAKPFEPEELLLRLERLIAWSARGAARTESLDGPPGATFLGRYEVKEVIGQGTMGTVYRGWDPRLQRSVALKTIRIDSIITESRRREMLGRLQNEAVTVARFNHPNIVAVYDMGDADDTAFMAMEFVEGVSLAHFLEGTGALEAERLIPLALGMARGLAAAHERLVIHRDVKPGNVLLGRAGAIKMTDFGVAHIVSKISDDTQHLYGTPGYVPPEALLQEPYTLAGDLFGLGATIFEAAAGIHPVVGESLKDTIDRTLNGELRQLGDLKPELPEEILRLVMALLSFKPEDRPTASAAVTVLEYAAANGNLSWSSPALGS